MASLEEIRAAYKKNSDVKLYYLPKNGVIISKYEPYSNPQWFADRKATKKTDASFLAKGPPDSFSGNNVNICKEDGVLVVSGYEPYTGKWFDDARKQGVEKYDETDEE
jgi:hypothetical protein